MKIEVIEIKFSPTQIEKFYKYPNSKIPYNCLFSFKQLWLKHIHMLDYSLRSKARMVEISNGKVKAELFWYIEIMEKEFDI